MKATNRAINEAGRLFRAQALADKAREEFKKHNCYYEIYTENGIVKIDIVWGDWKHDHLFADHIMAQLGAKHYSTDLTEEDGSDTYSAIHTYLVQ